MGTLLDIAREDARSFVSDTDGFSTPLTFTTLTDEEFTINGLASVHSQSFDSDGLPVIGDNSHICFSEKDVNDAGYTTRDANGNVNIRGWRVAFNHSVGAVSAILSRPEPDSTLGLIRVMITNYNDNE